MGDARAMYGEHQLQGRVGAGAYAGPQRLTLLRHLDIPGSIFTEARIPDPITSDQTYTKLSDRSRQLVSNTWPPIQHHLAPCGPITHRRLLSTGTAWKHRQSHGEEEKKNSIQLTHVSETGSAHMVSISDKLPTSRTAIAACVVHFSTLSAISLIRDNQMKKGDVLGVARVAGIMAAKRTPDLIPLCHPIAISHISIDIEIRGDAEIEIRATVACDGKTGVEMEALTAASTAALTVYDMCKAVDRGMVVDGLRVVLKDGGKSGRWEMR